MRLRTSGARMGPVAVTLIDASNLFREGMRTLLDDTKFQITDEASCVGQALSFSAPATTALVLIDTDKASDVSALKAVRPVARVVLLTEQINMHTLTSAIQAGADGILLKNMSPRALLESLCLVMMGEIVFPSALGALLSGSAVWSNIAPDANIPSVALSVREVQILQGLLEGASNKVIALALGITEATVKVHLKHVLCKISAANRTQAAIWALEHRLGSGRTATAAGWR